MQNYAGRDVINIVVPTRERHKRRGCACKVNEPDEMEMRKNRSRKNAKEVRDLSQQDENQDENQIRTTSEHRFTQNDSSSSLVAPKFKGKQVLDPEVITISDDGYSEYKEEEEEQEEGILLVGGSEVGGGVGLDPYLLNLVPDIQNPRHAPSRVGATATGLSIQVKNVPGKIPGLSLLKPTQGLIPENKAPTVPCLDILLYPGQPKLVIPIDTTCSLQQTIQLVRHGLRLRGVGEGWPELQGLQDLHDPEPIWSEEIWAAVVSEGIDRQVALVWRL